MLRRMNKNYSPAMSLGVVLLMVLLVEVQSLSNFTSNGPSGQLCGRSKCRAAPHPANCTDGECVCLPPYTNGLGTLFCESEDVHDCYLHSDPLVKTYLDHKYHGINLLVKNLMSHTVTSICSLTGDLHPSLRCEVWVYVWGERNRGKNFAKGVEVLFYISGAQYTYYKFYGEVVNGTYVFTRYDNSSGPLSSPGYGGTGFSIDPVNNQLVIGGLCGVEIFFRPEDYSNDTRQTSGVAVTVRKQCNPIYLDTFLGLCGSPFNDTYELTKIGKLTSQVVGFPVPPYVAALLVTFSLDIDQHVPGVSPALLAVYDLDCAIVPRAHAAARCAFLISLPRFVKCIILQTIGSLSSPAGTDLIYSLLGSCMTAFCSYSISSCQTIQNYLLSSPCSALVPEANTTILDYDCSRVRFLSSIQARPGSPEARLRTILTTGILN